MLSRKHNLLKVVKSCHSPAFFMSFWSENPYENFLFILNVSAQAKEHPACSLFSLQLFVMHQGILWSHRLLR